MLGQKNNILVQFITRYISLIVQLLILVVVGLYFYQFGGSLSGNHSNWSDFGNYLSGTIGILISGLAVLYVYKTYIEQKKQSFENTFQNYIANYYSLLSSIRERWMHTYSDTSGNPAYFIGREIFGNVIGAINGSLKITKCNIKDKNVIFIYVYDTHINVFQNYSSYVINVCNMIENSDLHNESEKSEYKVRFISLLSVYEMTVLLYIIKLKKNIDNRHIKSLEYLLVDMLKFSIDKSYDVRYRESIQHIIDYNSEIHFKTKQ